MCVAAIVFGPVSPGGILTLYVHLMVSPFSPHWLPYVKLPVKIMSFVVTKSSSGEVVVKQKGAGTN